MVKLGTYALGSAAGAVAVVYNAFKTRGQFYPAMMYLSTSKINVVILVNMGLVMVCALWQLVKNIFLGPLREAEVERLNEQSWREVMEILFVITIFRDEFSIAFLAMVSVLLLIKAFHWLAQKRIEYIETTPTVSRLSHLRIIAFMGFLLVLDCIFFYSNVSHLLATRRPSVELFFSFEYMILATTTISTFLKYVFYLSDMLMEGQWESKALFTFYLELVRDLLHLSLYLFFFLVIFFNKGLPLHLVRELYDTFRNFKSRVSDFIRYRKITSNMNDRFPEATAEELEESDSTCIICRDEMVAAKKLRCGHLFHVHCLRTWLERQQTCPTCRTPVIPPETAGTERAAQPEQHSAGTEGSQTGSLPNSSTGQNVEAQNPQAQHEARIRAAAAAAAQYASSFICPPGQPNTLSWSPGYVFVPSQSISGTDGMENNPTGPAVSPSVNSQTQFAVQNWAQLQTQMSRHPQPNQYILPNNFNGQHISSFTRENNLQGISGSRLNDQSYNNRLQLLNIQRMLLKQQIELLQQDLQSISQMEQTLHSALQGDIGSSSFSQAQATDETQTGCLNSRMNNEMASSSNETKTSSSGVSEIEELQS